MLRFPASERNREAILSVLKNYIHPGQLVLEVAAGSGQHCAHFAQHFTNTLFQPTDIDPAHLKSCDAYKTEHNLENMRLAKVFDCAQSYAEWTASSGGQSLRLEPLDVIYCANMIHISSHAAVQGLFRLAGTLLKHKALLITYGPYSVDGKISPQSNIDFDLSLRSRNDQWGYMDTNFLKELAAKNGLSYETIHDMPANNHMLVFKKQL